MKRIILFIIVALLSVQFVEAQTTSSTNFAKRYQDSIRNLPINRYVDSLRQIDLKRNLLTDEEFFERADLIIECKYLNFFEYYDAKGNYNPDDLYSIFKILVLHVFKGDSGLTGKTISFMKKGGIVYKLPTSEWEFLEEISSSDTSLGRDNGLSISDTYSSIQFLMKSDYPENPDKSKDYPQPKFKPIQNKERACIGFWGDGRIGGLNGLIFNNRQELYEYMSRYKGITVPKVPVPAYTPEIDYRRDFDSATQEIIRRKWDSEGEKSPRSSKATNNDTLTLATANQEVIYDAIGKSYLEFDLMASSNNPNVYFDGTPFLIEYNAAVFGTNVVGAGKIEATIDSEFNNYMLYQITDIQGGGVQNVFQVIFGVKINNPARLQLSSTPKRILHFRIEILPNPAKSTFGILFNNTHTTCYSSTYTLTANEPFGDEICYSMTTYIDSFIPAGEPEITTNLSAITVDAGVGQILTIQGVNFGSRRGIVQFSSADDGGATFLKGLDDQYYVSWSDTEIKVVVPSLVYKGYEEDFDKDYRGGAGTGPIQVQTAGKADSCQSATALNIRRSFTNYRDHDLLIQRTYLAKLACDHDFVFTLHTSVQGNQPAVTAIEAALNKWSALLNISIVLERDQAGNFIYINDKFINEFKNLIYFGAVNGMKVSRNFLPGYDISGSEEERKFYLTGATIQISNSDPWNYSLTTPVGSKLSFYQAFLHEIGHILLLQHVNDPSNLMYYEIKTGDPIIDVNAGAPCVQAAADIVALSKNIVWKSILIQGKCPITLSAPVPNPTVSIMHQIAFNNLLGEYRADVSGGFPPYAYHWEYISPGGGLQGFNCIIPSQYVNKQTIPESECKSPLRVTVTDKCGNQAQATIIPNKRLQALADDDLTVFPNPNRGTFEIVNIANATVYVYTAAMKLVRTFKNISESAKLDCGNLPTGLYILKIIDGEDVAVRKMILNR
ncbi:MAG: zinc-dependent metalloprotease [Bacteroidales bacterium]|nr:zinc-dependent metalloprotease [Bacteroidales bacterium]